MKIVFHDSALFEAEQATAWWERRTGKGVDFSQAIAQVIESISQNPYQFTPAPASRSDDQVRIATIRRFRYSVYFQILEEVSAVFIFAVQHGHRHPRHWTDRLGDFHLTEE